MMEIAEWQWAITDLIIPPVCAGCGVLGARWCRQCQFETRLLTQNICLLCGRPWTLPGKCNTCQANPPIFHSARAHAVYAAPFRNLIVELKYRGSRNLGGLVAEIVATDPALSTWQIDLALPVPLSQQREGERGYNQVDLFARPLCRRFAINYSRAALTRSRHTQSQVGMNGHQRRRNLRNAFTASPSLVAGKRILVFDDVYTTGSTTIECARALLGAGALHVMVYSLARAMGSQHELAEIA